MSQIRCRNTKPALALRKLLRANGVRGYRLHVKLLGRPDLYFPKRKTALFFDGCSGISVPSAI